MAATQDTIRDVIIQRLTVWNMMEPLLIKHGLDRLMDAIDDTASFYVGAEEIGSSDASAFVDSAVRKLGEPSIFTR